MAKIYSEALKGFKLVQAKTHIYNAFFETRMYKICPSLETNVPTALDWH